MKNRLSARLPGWDYRWTSDYFITICVKDFHNAFGEIENDKMNYTPIGILSEIFWHQIPLFNQHISLGTYVIMPNHMHGILHCKQSIPDKEENIDFSNFLDDNKRNRYSEISPKKGSISTIIRSYKSAVTKHSRRLGYDFEWHNRFYDHIIRNDKDYARIERYIDLNIENWSDDRFCL